ncbi:MAG: hypothetical protein ABW352_20740 [Polyangiales bacterium]
MTKLLALSLLPLSACVEFDPGSLITDTRVLGATVQVEGDLERATPRPGETANLGFVIEGVVLEPVVSWSLAVCLPTSTTCAEASLTSSTGRGSAPTLQVRVPAESALGDARSLHIEGVICMRGEPDATRSRCVGDQADGTPLVYELALARRDDDENLQPNVAQTRFRFDGQEWPEGDALAQGCRAQPELPQALADEKEHRITIELGPDARELYVGPDGEAMYEELQLSTFVNAGELERQFSFVSAADERERPAIELKWTSPKRKRVEGNDLGVRLLVLVRDSRGGLSRLERSLCTVREASGQLSARAVRTLDAGD